jgi:uncharacterized membrane protein YwzB
MPIMFVKRLLLAFISIAVGVAITQFIIVKLVLQTIASHYGNMYYFLTVMFIAIALGIWLDKFMGTEILPE